MNNKRLLFFLLLIAQSLLFSACSTKAPADYTAFIQASPRSILVLPPINNTTEIQAGNSMLSWSSISLGEMGYYVMPVALTNETFRHNGITEPEEAHALPLERLRKIFGADAVLYMTVEKFGTVFMVVSSVTQVRAKARLVDARSGTELWHGEAEVSSGSQGGSSSLVAMLITAVVDQIVNTTVDRAHTQVAPVVSGHLFITEKYGVYPGPYASAERKEKAARLQAAHAQKSATGQGPDTGTGAEPKASAPVVP